jgi:hypothetical protein
MTLIIISISRKLLVITAFSIVAHANIIVRILAFCLTSMSQMTPNDTLRNDTQFNKTQHNDTQYNDTKSNDTRYYDVQNCDIRINYDKNKVT